MLSTQSKLRLARLRAMKRAWYSLWILSIAFVLSLVAELWINDKPLFARIEGKNYYPLLHDYTMHDLGGEDSTMVDWPTVLKEKPAKVLMPLIPYGPLNSEILDEDFPPYAPSAQHLLGTDASGRDLLARLVYGFRTGMLFSLALTLVSTLLGIIIGGVQGYLGGKVDLFLQRIIEIWSALPFLYVIILAGAVLGQNFAVLLLASALFQWIGLSYFMRSEFYRVKNFGFVRSAQALGLSKSHIFFKEILPNALSPVITLFPFQIIGGISTLTALDFLGFGLQPPTPSWGELLSQGLQNLQAPWLTAFTVLALTGTLLLATFIGEGLREAFDPRGEDS